MLMSSSTDVYASLGSIVKEVLGGFWGWVILIPALLLGFLIIEWVIDLIHPPTKNTIYDYDKTG
jgi:hypothetical protein